MRTIDLAQMDKHTDTAVGRALIRLDKAGKLSGPGLEPLFEDILRRLETIEELEAQTGELIKDACKDIRALFEEGRSDAN